MTTPDYRKGHKKFWRMKIENVFWEKVKFGQFSTESEKIRKLGEI